MYHKQLSHDLYQLTPRPTNIPYTTAISAVESSHYCNASVIITTTNTGRLVTNHVYFTL